MKKILFVFTILLSAMASCDDPNEGELFITPPETEAEMSITDVLETQPQTYSMWIEFMKYADFYNALKNTDRATVFCPDNEAVLAFLQEKGVASIQELDKEYARNVVRTHIINGENINDSTLNQKAKDKEIIPNQTLFKSYLSMSYGYLVTDVDDADRTDIVFCPDSIFINNQARLKKFSVVCNNGTFFTTGDVIVPLTENVVEKLEQDGNYDIFAAAIRADHYADSVATLVADTTVSQNGSLTITQHRFTCFAVPDEVFRAAGINDVPGLKQWLVIHSPARDIRASSSRRVVVGPSAMTVP